MSFVEEPFLLFKKFNGFVTLSASGLHQFICHYLGIPLPTFEMLKELLGGTLKKIDM